jgi:hypothetical protein
LIATVGVELVLVEVDVDTPVVTVLRTLGPVLVDVEVDVDVDAEVVLVTVDGRAAVFSVLRDALISRSIIFNS